ncbi:MAG: hypothetical protein LBU66_02100, partial [Treponema sp.]|nr:hypothetical protein [Treponema sp.]
IDDKEMIDSMLLEDARKTTQAPQGRILDFFTMLRRLGVPVAASGASGEDEIRQRRERLKDL